MPILVVDDEPLFRSAVSAILRRAGFHTIEAQDGLEAFEIVRAIGASIELLLTDFQMPRMNGLSLIESVRELHPKIPVLLMTGSRLENRPRSYAVLNKPIGREAILQAVRSAIAVAGTLTPTLKVEVFHNGDGCSEALITVQPEPFVEAMSRQLDQTIADAASKNLNFARALETL